MLNKTLPLVMLALLLPSCSSAVGPDFGPVGAGLTAIGICVVASSVVRSLTTLVASKLSRPPAALLSKPRRSRNPQPEEEQP